MDEVAFRPARAADSPAITELYQMAAGGVADYIWSGLAGPGESVLDAGTQRFQRENTDFSYQHCLVAERDGDVVGMIHAYPIMEVQQVPDEVDPVLRPFCELESAPGLYIARVACYAEWCGQGIGTRLLDKTRRRAMGEGLPELSLIAFAEKSEAIRLYEREGFTVHDRRPMPDHPLIHYGGDAVLMVAPL